MAVIGQTSLNFGIAANTVITNVPCEIDAELGDWVRMQMGVAYRGLADSLENSNVIGIVEAKQGSTTCTIRFLGLSLAIYSSLDETKEYYLSDTLPGKMSILAPTIAGHVLLKLGQPFSTDRLLVNKGIRIKRS